MKRESRMLYFDCWEHGSKEAITHCGHFPLLAVRGENESDMKMATKESDYSSMLLALTRAEHFECLRA